MTKDKIITIFDRFKNKNPEPKGELNSINTYTFLVAVILSAQATDIGVNKATDSLFKVADTPEKMVKLGLKKLKDHIKTIGLYNAKAKNIIATCQMLIEQHQSEVPNNRADLEALPGVGRKTANVVLNTAFGEPTIAVDTHIFRVANRTGLAPGKNVAMVEAELEKRVPAAYKNHAHHWLILHGRYICKARKPDCPHCIIRDLCESRDKAV